MIFGALIGAGASLLGGSMSKGGKYKFRPFDVNAGPLGSVDMSKGGMNVTEGQFGQEARGFFEDQFRRGAETLGQQQDFGAGLLGYGRENFMDTFQAAQAAGYDPSAQALGVFNQQLGDIRGMGPQQAGYVGMNPFIAQAGMGPSAMGFGGAAGQFGMGLMGQTDLGQLAQDRTAQLTQLARPGEERAVNQRLQSLFSRGQLGTQGGAQALGALAAEQEQAATQRGLAGMDFAEQVRARNLGAAQGFMGLGLQGVGMDQSQALALGQMGMGLRGQDIGQGQFNAGQRAQFQGMLGDLAGQQYGAAFGLNQAQVQRAQERMRGMEGLFGFGQSQFEMPASYGARVLQGMQPLNQNLIDTQRLALEGARVASGNTGGGSNFGAALQGIGSGLFSQATKNWF